MPDEISKKLEVLMLGHGFNFYRTENLIRADDLLVRQRAGSILGHSAEILEHLAQEFQRSCIPAATREQPYPSADLLGRLNALRMLRQRVMNQGLFVQGLAAPAQDKIWGRMRVERELLEQLLKADAGMLELAADVENQAGLLNCQTWQNPNAGKDLAAALDVWDGAIRKRQDLMAMH